MKSITYKDGRQTLLVLPPTFIAHCAQAGAAKFSEVDVGCQLLTLLAKPTRETYALTKAHGSTQVTVRRTWLRWNGATSGDLVEAWANDSFADRVLLRLNPVASQPDAAARLLARVERSLWATTDHGSRVQMAA